MTNPETDREELWSRYLAGESLPPEEAQRLLAALKVDHAFLERCRHDTNIMGELVWAFASKKRGDVVRVASAPSAAAMESGDDDFALAAGEVGKRRRIKQLVLRDEVLVDVWQEDNDDFHLYLSAPRPDWESKAFTLTIGEHAEAGTWEDAGSGHVSCELFPTTEMGKALRGATASDVTISPDD